MLIRNFNCWSLGLPLPVAGSDCCLSGPKPVGKFGDGASAKFNEKDRALLEPDPLLSGDGSSRLYEQPRLSPQFKHL